MRLAALFLVASPLTVLAADRTVRFASPMYFLPPAKAATSDVHAALAKLLVPA